MRGTKRNEKKREESKSEDTPNHVCDTPKNWHIAYNLEGCARGIYNTYLVLIKETNAIMNFMNTTRLRRMFFGDTFWSSLAAVAMRAPAG